jgi:hypothetical protein
MNVNISYTLKIYRVTAEKKRPFPKKDDLEHLTDSLLRKKTAISSESLSSDTFIYKMLQL